MANVTRTSVKATVSFERAYKVDGKVETDYGDITLDKCDTREKAEILLMKEFKGSLVNVLDVKFFAETRCMSEEEFMEHSKIVKTEELSEEDLLAKAMSRKRSK